MTRRGYKTTWRTLLPIEVLLLAGMALTLGSSSASAAPFTPTLNLAYKLALDYWGREPIACSNIDAEIVPERSLDQEGTAIIGLATFPSPDAAPGSTPCMLFIDRSLAKPASFGQACFTMTHEMGHLLGYEHSTDPSSVMDSDAPLSAQPACLAESERIGGMISLRGLLARCTAHPFPCNDPLPRLRRELHRIGPRFWAPLRG